MLAERFKMERLGWGLSQEELANKSGVSIHKIRRIEQGKLSPSAKDIRAIGNILRRPILFFFNEECTHSLPLGTDT